MVSGISTGAHAAYGWNPGTVHSAASNLASQLATETTSRIAKSQVFNEQTQKAMAGYLVDKRIGRFMTSNRQSLRDAKLHLAREWASLGVPDNPGKS